MNRFRDRLLVPLAVALLVGMIFSFPNWWWYFTSPDYSVVRGYALSDDDMVPYAIGLNDASDGWPTTSSFLRSFESRHKTAFLSLTYWITNFLLGNLLRLVGSLELFVPVALLLSGIAIFISFYMLARQFLDSQAAAVLAALFGCFRYPFYLTWVATARRFVENGWQMDWATQLRLTFPSMVNAHQLYPHLRWPVPGMVYWWFLVSLYLIVRLARAAWHGSLSPSRKWLMVGAGVLVGLSAYIYFYFWSYLLSLLGVLAVIGWLANRKRLAWSMIGVSLVSLVFSIPLFVFLAGPIVRTVGSGQELLPVSPSNINFLAMLSTHGVIGVAVIIGALLMTRRPSVRDRAEAGWRQLSRFRAFRIWDMLVRERESLRSRLSPETVILFSLHITVVLLAAVELGWYYFAAYHWAWYVIDSLAPLTIVWLIYRQFKWRPADGQDAKSPGAPHTLAWSAAWLALCLGAGIAGWRMGAAPLEASWRTGLGLGILLPATMLLVEHGHRRVVILAAVVVTVGVWYLYHRTINEMSWVTFLPWGLWLAAHKRSWLRATGIAFIGLNLAVAVGLQGFVRPVMAQPFFSQPREYTQALEWLERNTEPESVVVTNGWLSDYLTRAYTHNLTFSVHNWWTKVGRFERQERFLIRSAIYQVTPEFFDRLRAERDDVVRTYKANVHYYWIGDRQMDFMYEKQAELLYDPQVYASIYLQPLENLLNTYRLDYLWVGPWERYVGRRDFDRAPEVVLVFKNSQIHIYRVVK